MISPAARGAGGGWLVRGAGPGLGSTKLRPVELPRPAPELDTVTADIVDRASKSGMELWRRGSASWPRLQRLCCRLYRYY